MVTDYYKEGTVLDYIRKIKKQKRYVEEKTIFQFILGIIYGVLYLHENGMVHRNLKLSNIFLKNGTIKIGDFISGFGVENELHEQFLFNEETTALITSTYSAPENIYKTSE